MKRIVEVEVDDDELFWAQFLVEKRGLLMGIDWIDVETLFGVELEI